MELLPRLDYPIVVLVAGAWHGGWAWRRVAPALAAYGWPVEVIELPSTAPAGLPRCGLHDDAAVIRQQVMRFVEKHSAPAVVVAHSYAGAAATEGLAGVDAVQHLIYLAAHLLDVDESVLGIGTPPWWRFDRDMIIASHPLDLFFSDVPRRDARWAVEQLQPTSHAAFGESLQAAAWHTIPSTYVICELDHAFPVVLQERFALRAGTVERLNTGHSPFLARPAELTQLIIDIAGKAEKV